VEEAEFLACEEGLHMAEQWFYHSPQRALQIPDCTTCVLGRTHLKLKGVTQVNDDKPTILETDCTGACVFRTYSPQRRYSYTEFPDGTVDCCWDIDMRVTEVRSHYRPQNLTQKLEML
jgi:hypothetical protein